MTDKQIIIDGCEFQSDCIEYKDISYLKIMPICAIHELSIACHDKVNKCKYYKLYKQLQAKEQECEELKEAINGLLKIQYQLADSCNKYVQTLTKIKEIALGVRNYLACPSPRDVRYEMDIILQKISECEEVNKQERIKNETN